MMVEFEMCCSVGRWVIFFFYYFVVYINYYYIGCFYGFVGNVVGFDYYQFVFVVDSVDVVLGKGYQFVVWQFYVGFKYLLFQFLYYVVFIMFVFVMCVFI